MKVNFLFDVSQILTDNICLILYGFFIGDLLFFLNYGYSTNYKFNSSHIDGWYSRFGFYS
jgi:hypothetical protein